MDYLDDGLILQLLHLLPAPSLAAAAHILAWGGAAGGVGGAGGGAPPTIDWRQFYRNRVHADARWRGSLPSPQPEVLRLHAGPVFGATFLEPPFPPGLAISAGVCGEQEEVEATLWEVVLCGFSGQAMVATICPLPTHAQPASDRRAHAGGGSGSSPPAVAVAAAAEAAVEGAQQHVWPADAGDLPAGAGASGGGGAAASTPGGGSPPGSPGSRGWWRRRGGAAALAAAQAPSVSRLPALQRQEATSLRCLEECSRESALPRLGAGYSLTVDCVLSGHQGACVSAATQQDLVATAAFDGRIKLWRTPDDEPGSSGAGGPGRAAPILAPVASLSDPAVEDPVPPPVVKIWDVERRAVTARMEGHLGWVWNMAALSGDLSVLATGGTDSCVCTWDARAGERVGTVEIACLQPDNVYPIGGLAARMDGCYLVAGCFDGSVYIIDCRQMQVVHKLAGHTDRVTRVSCQRDTVLSGSLDGNCCLWEFGALPRPLHLHNMPNHNTSVPVKTICLEYQFPPVSPL
ncbi:hypothetical protein ABPG75_005523 [Micractinium tetrahymenae]